MRNFIKGFLMHWYCWTSEMFYKPNIGRSITLVDYKIFLKLKVKELGMMMRVETLAHVRSSHFIWLLYAFTVENGIAGGGSLTRKKSHFGRRRMRYFTIIAVTTLSFLSLEKSLLEEEPSSCGPWDRLLGCGSRLVLFVVF